MKVRRLATAAAALLVSLTAPGPASAQDEPRIVGGSTVSPSAYAAQWPWLVIVTIRINAFTEGECTGSVIAPQWVMTAAHCVVGENLPHSQYSASSFTVSGGSPEASNAGQLGTVDAVYHDSSYTPSDLFNQTVSAKGDVALLHLAAPVTGIALPYLPAASPRGATVATALGWGQTSGSSDVSPTLRAVRVTVHPTDADTLYNPGPDGTCNGDSGGPLATGWIIIGTTSYGDSDCTTDNYYTDTASVTPWIMSTTAGVAGSTPPRIATPPRLSARDVVVRANTARVSLSLAKPTASAGTVICNRPMRRTVAVPSRTLTRCTATSPGGSTTTSYAVSAQRSATAVVVKVGGKRVTRVHRRARTTLSAGGFAPSTLVRVQWGERRTTVRASRSGTVRLHLSAPRSAGTRTVLLTGAGTRIQIRAQAVRIR